MMSESSHKTSRIVGGAVLLAILVGLLGALKHAADNRAEQESLRRRHAAMTNQIAEIKSGAIDCLVNPDPDFLDELLADAECKANLKTVYLGSDVADPRLGRLRELPKMECLVFYWTENPDVLLERLRGMESIKAISFDRSSVSPQGFEHIATMPNLKSLSVPLVDKSAKSLDALKGHATLEHLTLRRSKRDDALIPILKSLPRLKSVSIKSAFERKGEAQGFLGMLKSKLPDCQCSVEDVDGG
jgi:hypothetical protein